MCVVHLEAVRSPAPIRTEYQTDETVKGSNSQVTRPIKEYNVKNIYGIKYLRQFIFLMRRRTLCYRRGGVAYYFPVSIALEKLKHPRKRVDRDCNDSNDSNKKCKYKTHKRRTTGMEDGVCASVQSRQQSNRFVEHRLMPMEKYRGKYSHRWLSRSYQKQQQQNISIRGRQTRR